MKGLRGKRVVVTGGSSGIGEATVRRFRDEGAEVVSIALDGEIECDVADPRQVEAVFAQIGELDVLVANAGISIRSPFLDIREEDWQRVLDVNLGGVFRCAQQAARRMSAGAGGVILMTASTNGLTGHPFYADYNASKAGVILLARTMARELAPRIRVNAVCPGYVLTPMQRAEYTDEMLAEVNAGIPLGRHAEPVEIAAPVMYAASSLARKAKSAAISSGSACRCRGIPSLTAASISSVYSARCMGVST